jgi:ribosomal protein L23
MSETIAAPQTIPVSTPPPGVEPVVISGGESPASWEELDAVTAKHRVPKETHPKEDNEPSEPKQSRKEKEETEEKVEVKGSKQKKDEGVEKPDQTAKLLKLKSGDKEIELAADAKVPVKIDGKTVDVSLQEAINRYSQQSHLDSLYKTYKTDKESFESQRKLMSDALNKSYDYLVNQKDLRGFMDFLGESMGVDSQELYQNAVGEIQKQMEEWSGLSPEERKLRELEVENQYHRKRMEAAKTEKLQAKSRAELESQVTKTMEQYSMDKAALVKAWDDLTSLGHKPEDITPEFLGTYHQNTQTINLIETKLAEISQDLATNQEIVEQLATFANQTDATSDEIAAAIEQIYGETPEKKLTKKIERNQKSNAQRGSKAQKNPGSDPLFFDDI